MVIPLFFLAFSTLYLSLSHAKARPFSQPLDHTAALYCSITVFSTVGFGDITPVSHPARIVVSIQMLLDLVVLGVGRPGRSSGRPRSAIARHAASGGGEARPR